MPLQLRVRILDYPLHAACVDCGKIRTHNRQIHVFVDPAKDSGFSGGNKALGPLCSDCLYVHENTGYGGIQLEVELEDPPKKGPPSKLDKKLSKKQEQRIASDIGGRMQPGSGNQAHAKSDVRKKGEFRVEAKFTRNKSFPLKKEILDKISGECVGKEKPVVQIDFVEGQHGQSRESWVVIPYEHWEEMINAGKDR